MFDNLPTNNKALREQREFETLYKNPKHARTSWAQKVFERWSAPAIPPIPLFDKDKNELPQSVIERTIYENICAELNRQGLDRLPTEGEMAEACQSYYSRHNASSYTAKRDSMGAKPIDEAKQQHSMNNPFEGMTDEELAVMAKALDDHRNKQLEDKNDERQQIAVDVRPEE